ncbi:MAG: alpha-D-ribose 1-methylphosphonate 5-triphosphate diphosphatase [Bauldia sp.]|nr:alpha-D-ribose 1-methylphosphonate 5-triphosphate diphosphatase [Bauldia sp.]
MSTEFVIRNVAAVLADEVRRADILVRDGVIVSIDAPGGGPGEDFGGDILIPGLVELHTDHLETHYAPRPSVRWNPMAAVQAHDAQMAASGVTTVFDALRVGMDEDVTLDSGDMRVLADAILAGMADGHLRADHYLHLRCEVSSSDVMEAFALFEDNPRVRLASLMDHTPGQRQFTSLDAYRVYYQGKSGMTDEAFADFVRRRQERGALGSDGVRQELSRRCLDRGIVLASHDDALDTHVAEAQALGIAIAEFPTTREAAEASRAAGMTIMMGAPNLVRGGSHSGNVSARDLAARGLLDAESSDYIPFSLIQAAFVTAATVEGFGLPRAIALVTSTPARAAGFADRGTIAPGLRADLVRVAVRNGMPVVRGVWREGTRVA